MSLFLNLWCTWLFFSLSEGSSGSLGGGFVRKCNSRGNSAGAVPACFKYLFPEAVNSEYQLNPLSSRVGFYFNILMWWISWSFLSSDCRSFLTAAPPLHQSTRCGINKVLFSENDQSGESFLLRLSHFRENCSVFAEHLSCFWWKRSRGTSLISDTLRVNCGGGRVPSDGCSLWLYLHSVFEGFKNILLLKSIFDCEITLFFPNVSEIFPQSGSASTTFADQDHWTRTRGCSCRSSVSPSPFVLALKPQKSHMTDEQTFFNSLWFYLDCLIRDLSLKLNRLCHRWKGLWVKWVFASLLHTSMCTWHCPVLV